MAPNLQRLPILHYPKKSQSDNEISISTFSKSV